MRQWLKLENFTIHLYRVLFGSRFHTFQFFWFFNSGFTRVHSCWSPSVSFSQFSFCLCSLSSISVCHSFHLTLLAHSINSQCRAHNFSLCHYYCCFSANKFKQTTKHERLNHFQLFAFRSSDSIDMNFVFNTRTQHRNAPAAAASATTKCVYKWKPCQKDCTYNFICVSCQIDEMPEFCSADFVFLYNMNNNCSGSSIKRTTSLVHIESIRLNGKRLNMLKT